MSLIVSGSVQFLFINQFSAEQYVHFPCSSYCLDINA